MLARCVSPSLKERSNIRRLADVAVVVVRHYIIAVVEVFLDARAGVDILHYSSAKSIVGQDHIVAGARDIMPGEPVLIVVSIGPDAGPGRLGNQVTVSVIVHGHRGSAAGPADDLIGVVTFYHNLIRLCPQIPPQIPPDYQIVVPRLSRCCLTSTEVSRSSLLLTRPLHDSCFCIDRFYVSVFNNNIYIAWNYVRIVISIISAFYHFTFPRRFFNRKIFCLLR